MEDRIRRPHIHQMGVTEKEGEAILDKYNGYEYFRITDQH